MGASTLVATTPGTLVTVPATYTLFQRITVTSAGGYLTDYLSGGALPIIPANPTGNADRHFTFGFVDLQADDTLVAVRWTDDGQPSATSTVGFVVTGPPMITRIPVHPDKIYLISTGADVNVQVRLGVMGTDR